MMFMAEVVLPFPHTARAAVKAMHHWRKPTPQEWKEAVLEYQTPLRREFISRYPYYTTQLYDGTVIVKIGSFLDEEAAKEFIKLFKGCRGSIEKANLEALVGSRHKEVEAV